MSFTPAKRTALLTLILLALLGVVYIIWSTMTSHSYRTDDAYVTADYTLMAPRVSGYIREVHVSDNQQVKAGDLLATIDDRDYRVSLESANAGLLVSEAKLSNDLALLDRQQATIAQSEAAVSASRASLDYAQHNAGRYRALLKSGTATADEQQKTQSTMLSAAAGLRQSEAALLAAQKEIPVLQASIRQAEADIAASRAQVDQAKLNLSYTRIVAPISGSVGQRTLREGAWVSAGTRLLAIVPLQHTYILANFLETQLAHVRHGQPVNITVDALPGLVFRGHVDSIAPATGATFAAITADNATGNYTKVVQRLPVKILIDDDQPNRAQLRVGMSVIPQLETR